MMESKHPSLREPLGDPILEGQPALFGQHYHAGGSNCLPMEPDCRWYCRWPGCRARCWTVRSPERA